jgi:hypothetical protein
MYELRPAKPSNPLVPVYWVLGIVIGIPVLYALLLIVAAFLMGFLGM